MVSERPILFSTEMVKSILDGRKSQTRRVVKFPHDSKLGVWEPMWFNSDGATDNHGNPVTVIPHWIMWHTRHGWTVRCPYGVPGDRLWVREAFRSFSQRHVVNHDAKYPSHLHYAHYPDVITIYKADGSDFPAHFYDDKQAHWQPSIHMHRYESRILLEITEVRVQRVQSITREDTEAEGVGCNWQPDSNQMATFQRLWDSINAKRGYGWDANPFVWCISFKVLPNRGEK